MQRVCVIGLGPIGNLHADVYQEMDGAELVAVCDIDRERADAAAQRLGVPAFYSAAEMLEALEADVASVATSGVRDFSDTFRNRLSCFIEQLNAGARPDEIDGSGADGLAAQEVLAAAIESIRNETVVYVDKCEF